VPPEVLDVEISLVNTSNRELLHGCLSSLPTACEGLRWHATVVDNASTDGSPEMVDSEFPWAKVLRNEGRLGFSANHNRVLLPTIDQRHARYVLILNEDTQLEAGSLFELVRFCDSDERCGAAGPVILGPDGLVERSFFSFPTILDQFRASLLPGRLDGAPPSAGWLNGSCVLVRVEALRQIGPLDERFFIFFEDTDLCLRLAAAGWTVRICEQGRIVHLGHQTVSQRPMGDSMERQMLRSRYLYFWKHEGPARAGAVAGLVRIALAARATKALAGGIVGGDQGERDLASGLWRLARYDPARPLPHERAVEAVA
jgi:GT2 family glycosyltransferase